MFFIHAQSGIQWHYDCEGEGKPLVFLHGWGVDRRVWRQQCKYFSRSFQVLAFDLPGHGKSDWREISLEQIAGDLIHIFETLDLKDIVTVGSSLGGLLSIHIFREDPKRIKKMVLVGAMPKFVRAQDYPCGLTAEDVLKLAGMLQRDYPSMVHIFFRSLFTARERSSRRFKWIQKFRQNDSVPAKDALLHFLNILMREDLREVLERVHLPMQFINGDQDYICALKTIGYLKTLQPRGRFDFFRDCGHFPFLSKPYEFNAVLEEFLKEI